MRKVSLFSGVGGLDLAAHWAGMETVLFCEREPFAQNVLQKHWPDVPIIDDVHNVTREEIERLGIGTIDALSAGFPCQPFSSAGKREGTEDERYLWPQVVRVLTELEPPWFVGENVAGLLSMAEPDGEPRVESRTVLLGEEEDLYEGLFTQQEKMLFGHICKDLEDIGFEVQPFVIPAAAVNAKNLRERIGILGYSERFRQSGKSRRRAREKPTDGHCGVESGDVADAYSRERPEWRWYASEDARRCSCNRINVGRRKESNAIYNLRWPTQPGMGRDPNVLSSWLDGSGVNPLDALAEFIASYPQPALLGQAQRDWEPPRVAVGVKDRAPRLKALGNAVNPLQFFPYMYAVRVIHEWLGRR